MTIHVHALPTDVARAFQAGAPDAHGNPPETRRSSTSDGLCRHCLCPVRAGEDYLVLAYRPFESLHPYAEVGPIFLHSGPCERYDGESAIPGTLAYSPDYLLKGYGSDERIVYGTGKVTDTAEIGNTAEALLARPEIAWVDVRSARNNCFQMRITRA